MVRVSPTPSWSSLLNFSLITTPSSVKERGAFPTRSCKTIYWEISSGFWGTYRLSLFTVSPFCTSTLLLISCNVLETWDACENFCSKAVIPPSASELSTAATPSYTKISPNCRSEIEVMAYCMPKPVKIKAVHPPMPMTVISIRFL